jgi:translocation and assembly module TamB
VLRLEGSAKAGGLVTLRGQVRLLDEQGPSAEVRVRGNRIYAVRLPDRLVQASPDLTVSYAAGIVTTQGRVTIPKADLVIRELPESAASPSPDAVVHDREMPPGTGQGQVIRGEIEIVLGRDVHLKAFGLDTMLEGTVTLKQGEDREPKGYGVVRLREGKFGAYGKELTIERGTLGFAGPLDDPAVDLRASRTVDWEGKRVTAGILLAGTASRPESRVFSDPAMSEADALSYLISGRPMQSTNANDQSAIAGAALALGVQQTSPLTQRLGSAVTLDELGLEGGTLDETEVVAGKQIGSDLYVRFTYGLFSRIGSVLARYKIGRNVSIEAASGEDQSLDLIYSIERD